MTQEQQAIQALKDIFTICAKSDTEDVNPWRALGDIHSICESALQEIMGEEAFQVFAPRDDSEE